MHLLFDQIPWGLARDRAAMLKGFMLHTERERRTNSRHAPTVSSGSDDFAMTQVTRPCDQAADSAVAARS